MFEKPVITSGLGNNTAQTHKQQDGERRRERRSKGEGKSTGEQKPRGRRENEAQTCKKKTVSIMLFTWWALAAKPKPSCRQTTMASLMPQFSLQMEPQRLTPPTSISTSTRPSDFSLPPARRTWRFREGRESFLVSLWIRLYVCLSTCVPVFMCFSPWPARRCWGPCSGPLHPGCVCRCKVALVCSDTQWSTSPGLYTARCSCGWDRCLQKKDSWLIEFHQL